MKVNQGATRKKKVIEWGHAWGWECVRHTFKWVLRNRFRWKKKRKHQHQNSRERRAEYFTLLLLCCNRVIIEQLICMQTSCLLNYSTFFGCRVTSKSDLCDCASVLIHQQFSVSNCICLILTSFSAHLLNPLLLASYQVVGSPTALRGPSVPLLRVCIKLPNMRNLINKLWIPFYIKVLQ